MLLPFEVNRMRIEESYHRNTPATHNVSQKTASPPDVKRRSR